MQSPLDRAIMQATQTGLPLTPTPYADLANTLGVSEAEVMVRLRTMHADGRLRRIAAVPNHYALGYRANGMSVWDVDDAHAVQLGERLGALPFVSHCYLRPRHLPMWPYNLFAMVHGHTRAETDQLVSHIATLLGEACRAHTVLYSTQILKKTGLRLAGESA